MGYKVGVIGCGGISAAHSSGYKAPQTYAFHIYGTDGMISVNAPQNQRLRLINKSGEQPVSLTNVNSYQAEIEELLAWLEGKKEHRSAARRGREALEVLMAIMESSRLRKVIYLPLENRESPLYLMIRGE